MLHVNRQDGFTIAVSESKHVAQIAKRTVLSDNALPTLVPILWRSRSGRGRKSGSCSSRTDS